MSSVSGLALVGLIVVAMTSRTRPAAPVASPTPAQERPRATTPPPHDPVVPRDLPPPEGDSIDVADPIADIDEPTDAVEPIELERLLEEAARLEEEAAKLSGPRQVQLRQRIVDCYEAALGDDSLDARLAQALTVLGLVYHNDARNFREALTCCQKAIRIREQEPSSPARDATLTQLRVWRANLLAMTGDDEGARTALADLVRTLEQRLGPDHFQVGIALSAYARAILSLGDLAKTRDLAARAVAILEPVAGTTGEAHLIEARRGLADVSMLLGELDAARIQLEKAIATVERSGQQDRAAPLLRHLGDIYRRQGLYPEAHATLSRAFRLNEAAGASADPATLQNFGILLREMGLTTEARAMLQGALEGTQRIEGSSSPGAIQCRIDLSCALGLDEAIALLESIPRGSAPIDYYIELPRRYLEAKQPARAKQHLETFVSIYTERSGGQTPQVAEATVLLARVHTDLGELAAAQQALAKALAIQERTLPASHPDLLATRSAQAALLVRQDKPTEARSMLEGVIAQTEAGLVRELAILSPRERLAAMARQQRVLAEWLTLCRSTTSDDPGYGPVLRLKGLVGRRDEAEQRALRRADADVRALHATLRETQRKLSRLLYAGTTDAARAELAATKQRCDELERELARRSKDFAERDRRLALGVREVQAQLKQGEALVDFVRDTERYVAFVLRSKGPARRFDLGDTTAVEAAVGLYRKSLLDGVSGASMHSSGRSLRTLVWDPLAPALEGARVVLLVPDGALGSLPFAALPAREADRHLGEQVAFAHLATAQDLVPWPDERPSGRGALGLGGIDYDRAAAPGGMGFAPLAATADEVQSCLHHYATSTKDESRVLTGRDATEAAVRALVPGRRVVHFATHGFVRLDLPSALAKVGGRGDVTSSLIGFDPLLLSGLALAGANASRGGGSDDGILTALEAAQLDMEGVDLVVLSACDTANGSAQAGEGVIGLLRGFRQSGARNAVASLWPVSDLATRVLMEVLYTRTFAAAERRPIAVALNEAALALRDFTIEDEAGKPQRPFAHPTFWAAFVAYGPLR